MKIWESRFSCTARTMKTVFPSHALMVSMQQSPQHQRQEVKHLINLTNEERTVSQ